MNREKMDYLIKVAIEQRGKGVICEPRGYYDVLTLVAGNSQPVQFPSDTFRNGEQFPVRITHMLASVRALFEGEAPLFQDERLIQRASLRLEMHDHYYMNKDVIPLPAWANKITSAPFAVSLGTSSWIFDQPVILSSRDIFNVRCIAQPQTFTDGAIPVTVSFTGIGLLSKRPYFFASKLDVSADTVTNQFPTEPLRNDGTEPVAITDVTFDVAGAVNAGSAGGDVRRFVFQIKQVSNGTQAEWFQGPTAELSGFMPGALTAVSTGRTLVHQFPGDGLLWKPGEGLQAAALANDSDLGDGELYLGFLGYIEVR